MQQVIRYSMVLVGLCLFSTATDAALITSFPGTDSLSGGGFASAVFESDGIDDHYDIVLDNFHDGPVSAVLGASLTVTIEFLYANDPFLFLTWDEGPYNLAPSGEGQFELEIGSVTPDVFVGEGETLNPLVFYTVIVDGFSATGLLPTSGTLIIPFTDFSGASPSDFTAVNFLQLQLFANQDLDGGDLEVVLNQFPTAEALEAVPEPSSIALLGIGLLGLAGRCARRRRSA